MCANYPKGHKDLLREWIETYHPGALILQIERTSGSHQDLAAKGIELLHMDRPYWIELSEEILQTPGDNILQENIVIIL